MEVLKLHQTVGNKGMHVHIAILRNGGVTGRFGGTLRQSIAVSLEMIVIQAFAFVLRTLDRDFNLSLLYQNDELTQMWYSLS